MGYGISFVSAFKSCTIALTKHIASKTVLEDIKKLWKQHIRCHVYADAIHQMLMASVSEEQGRCSGWVEMRKCQCLDQFHVPANTEVYERGVANFLLFTSLAVSSIVCTQFCIDNVATMEAKTKGQDGVGDDECPCRFRIFPPSRWGIALDHSQQPSLPPHQRLPFNEKTKPAADTSADLGC